MIGQVLEKYCDEEHKADRGFLLVHTCVPSVERL